MLCMYRHTHTYTYRHIHIHMHIHIYIYIYTHIRAYPYTYNTHMHTCVQAFVCLSMQQLGHASQHAYIYIYTERERHTHTCMYINANTCSYAPQVLVSLCLLSPDVCGCVEHIWHTHAYVPGLPNGWHNRFLHA